ncbi:hypothetical protein D3C76_1508970 [compost metagenome]
MQAMAGIDDQPLGQAKGNAIHHPLQLLRHLRWRLRIGIATGVQLNGRRPYATRCFDLTFIGIDE